MLSTQPPVAASPATIDGSRTTAWAVFLLAFSSVFREVPPKTLIRKSCSLNLKFPRHSLPASQDMAWANLTQSFVARRAALDCSRPLHMRFAKVHSAAQICAPNYC